MLQTPSVAKIGDCSGCNANSELHYYGHMCLFHKLNTIIGKVITLSYLLMGSQLQLVSVWNHYNNYLPVKRS